MDLHGSTAARSGFKLTASHSEKPEASGGKAGWDVSFHPDSFRLSTSYASPGTEPSQRSVSVSEHNVAVVRDGIRGQVETGKKASPEFFLYLEKIRSLLAGPLTEESLEKTGELYELINECDFFTAEAKMLDDLKKRISFRFSEYVEQQKSELVKQLKTCFTIRGIGGADHFYEHFTANIKRLFSKFTPPMQKLLHGVGLTIVSSQLGQGVKQKLTKNLCDNTSPKHGVRNQSPAVLAELREFARIARMIVEHQGKQKPAVMLNYLERLSVLLNRKTSMSAEDLRLHLEALELIDSSMTGTMAISPGSDAEN